MSPISIRICVPNLVAVRLSCRNKGGGGTDRPVDRQRKLQLYIPFFVCVHHYCLLHQLIPGLSDCSHWLVSTEDVNIFMDKRCIQPSPMSYYITAVIVSVYFCVVILANNAFRTHHASVHVGLLANGLSDICFNVFEMILVSCLK